MGKAKYKGIYAYKDIKSGEIVYIGKDSQLYRKSRHNQHHSKSRYSVQKINKILQSNPGRYEYIEIIILPPGTTHKELDDYEIRYIDLYKPKFNFTIGGDGAPTNKGKKFTEEHKLKISKANTGKKRSKHTKRKISDIISKRQLGKPCSEETKRKISESEKGKIVTMETRLKQSKNQNTTGYYRVQKTKDKRMKQGFIWVYKWRENGKQKKLSSTSLFKLEEKVLAKGLDWIDYNLFEDS